MKTLHPAAAGPFYPPCVSLLLLKRSVKTLSQEVRAWRKERCVSVWVTHLKISPYSSCSFCWVTLTCESELQLERFGSSRRSGVTRWSDRERMFVRGVIGADGGRRLWWNRLGATGQVERQEKTGAGIVQLHRPKTKWLPFARSSTEAESRKLFLISVRLLTRDCTKTLKPWKNFYIFILSYVEWTSYYLVRTKWGCISFYFDGIFLPQYNTTCVDEIWI